MIIRRQAKKAIPRDLEIESAQLFGKHLTPDKQKVLLFFTLAACVLPLILGFQMWDQIPEQVTAIPGGRNDPAPRWVIALGLPGVLLALEGAAHYILWRHQKRMTVPPPLNRMVGRWGFPVFSLLVCGGLILSVSGHGLPESYFVPCVVGLALMMLGSHMYDCPEKDKVSLKFALPGADADLWKKTHRLAGWVWMAVGLVLTACAVLSVGSEVLAVVAAVVALAIPVAYGRLRSAKVSG